MEDSKAMVLIGQQMRSFGTRVFCSWKHYVHFALLSDFSSVKSKQNTKLKNKCPLNTNLLEVMYSEQLIHLVSFKGQLIAECLKFSKIATKKL